MLLNCGVGEDSLESLGCKEIKPVNLKGDQSWTFIGRTCPFIDGHKFEQAPVAGDVQGSLAWFSLRGCKELDKTEWLNWTALICCCSVAHSCLTLCNPWTAARQASLSFTTSLSLLKLHLSQWCYPTILSFVVPFFSCLQSFPGSGSFLINHFFASGGQSIGAPALASFLLMNN